MKIIFNEKNDKNMAPIYLYDKGRVPSVTDIKFINRNLIIVAHRYAYKLYLISIDNEKDSYQILDTYSTIDQNKKVHFCESFEIIYNQSKELYQLYMIFFSNLLWIFDVNIKNYKFIFKKSILLNNQNTYHGIKIYNHHLYLSPSNIYTSNKSNNVLEINLFNYHQKYLPLGSIQDNYRLKDICFINDNMILLLIIYKTNIGTVIKNQITNGAFGLFSFPEFKLVDKIEFKHIHFDRVISDKNNNFYVTTQDENSGKIYKGSVDLLNKKIILLNYYIVDDFPHGLDIYEDLFVYTSYDTHSVNIEYLEKYK